MIDENGYKGKHSGEGVFLPCCSIWRAKDWNNSKWMVGRKGWGVLWICLLKSYHTLPKAEKDMRKACVILDASRGRSAWLGPGWKRLAGLFFCHLQQEHEQGRWEVGSRAVQAISSMPEQKLEQKVTESSWMLRWGHCRGEGCSQPLLASCSMFCFSSTFRVKLTVSLIKVLQ